MNTILVCIVLALLIVALLAAIFWLFSNIKSMALGAPAISSPLLSKLNALAKPKQTWLDLGCGSGTMIRRLAKQVKRIYGIEYSPFYYLFSSWRTRKDQNATIIYGDLRTCDWPKVDVIYCYLLPEIMSGLEDRLLASGSTIVCLSFPLKKVKPSKIIADQGRKIYIYSPAPTTGRSLKKTKLEKAG